MLLRLLSAATYDGIRPGRLFLRVETTPAVPPAREPFFVSAEGEANAVLSDKRRMEKIKFYL